MSAHGTIKYRAFISYSHSDTRWARWLHSSLESYVVPSALVGRETPFGPVPRRLRPIFRDREELASSPDLSSVIQAALAQSSALVVLCSPRAAASRWVNEEIIAFKRLGRADRIFAIIVDGEPNSADPASECFPPALRFKLAADGTIGSEPDDPVAADARPQGDGKDDAKLKLIAGLLAVGLNDLKQRELVQQRRRFRRILALTGGVAATLFVLTALALVALYASVLQRRDSLARESEVLAAASERESERGNAAVAMALALRALPQEGPQADRPYLPAAYNALLRAYAARISLGALIGHVGTVSDLAFSPDGATIASVSADGTIRLWDAATGSERAAAGIPANAFVAFDKDGSEIYAAANSSITVFDAKTLAIRRTLDVQPFFMAGLNVHPNGQRLIIDVGGATNPDAGGAYEIDAQTGAVLRRFAIAGSGTSASALTPDGAWLATGEGTSIHLWDFGTGALLSTIPLDQSVIAIADLVFLKGHSVIAVSTGAGVQAFDTATGMMLGSHEGDYVAGISSRPALTAQGDGSVLLVAGGGLVDDGIIEAYAAEDLALLWRQPVSPKTLSRLEVSNGIAAVVPAYTNEVRLVAVSGESDIRLTDENEFFGVSFSPDGRALLTQSISNKPAILWDRATGRRLASFTVPVDSDFDTVGQMAGAAITPGGQSVLALSVYGRAIEWDLTGTKVLREWPRETFSDPDVMGGAKSLKVSAGGAILIVESNGALIADWPTLDVRHRVRLDERATVFDAALSTDGAMLAIALTEPPPQDAPSIALGRSVVDVFAAVDGKPILKLLGHEQKIEAVAFSPDGKLIATGSADQTVRLWNANDGSPLAVMRGHTDAVRSIAFSPGGDMLLSASLDGSARLWTLQGELVLSRRGYGAGAAAAFSPDGSGFAMATTDGTGQIIDLPLDCAKLIEKARAFTDTVGRPLGAPPTTVDGSLARLGYGLADLAASWIAAPEEQSCHPASSGK